MSFEAFNGFWQEGLRRLERAEPSERSALDRVVDALVVELRRRLGGPFTLLHTEEYSDHASARVREKYLKSGVGREWLREHLARGRPLGRRLHQRAV